MSKPALVIRKWLLRATPNQAQDLAVAADTSVAHLRHIAAGRRGMTAEMAQRLAHGSTQFAETLWLDQRTLCKACGVCQLVK